MIYLPNKNCTLGIAMQREQNVNKFKIPNHIGYHLYKPGAAPLITERNPTYFNYCETPSPLFPNVVAGL